jgi:hypothetical protein
MAKELHEVGGWSPILLTWLIAVTDNFSTRLTSADVALMKLLTGHMNKLEVLIDAIPTTDDGKRRHNGGVPPLPPHESNCVYSNGIEFAHPINHTIAFVPAYAAATAKEQEAAEQLCPHNHHQAAAAKSSGLFKVCCVDCEKMTGWLLMRTGEGPAIMHDIMISRMKVAPPVMLYDIACRCARYSNWREPKFFKNTKWLVDKFHFGGHKMCPASCNPYLHPFLLNNRVTQLCEQHNACHSSSQQNMLLKCGQNVATFLLRMWASGSVRSRLGMNIIDQDPNRGNRSQ